ncbi:UPF0496 protein At1g20180 [Euphorbia lathyris]|uniref:UPF0496 protein At1g20180 n=1 Tax=Euphorbia lathyris TaxID=212925 RepID=UPI00331332D0
MSSMGKLWGKFKSPFSRTGRSDNEDGNNLSKNPNVNEEYKEAFRTTSYVEMWNRIHGQIRRRSIDGGGLERLPSTPPSSSSSSSLPKFYVHLSDYLFQPEHKATLTGMVHSMDFHRLLIDYFESSLEACNICDLLLRNIHQTRVNYRRIEKVIKLSKSAKHSTDYTKKMRGSILRELSAYAMLKNPLSFVSQTEFRDLHDNNLDLLHKLNSEQRKIRRKAKLKRIWKRIGGYCLVVAHSALLIALLVIAIHGFVGIVVAPGLITCFLRLFKKKKKSFFEKLCAQLDVAAKGTYILVNDFDTVSRLVASLSDELEHKKALAEMCVRHKNSELLKEVVKEFYMHDSCYQEQLDELEEHVYLCFHTINRSRRLVLRELMVAQQQ